MLRSTRPTFLARKRELPAASSEASSIEAAERRLDLGFAGEFPALSLGETFEDRSQMGRSNRFALTFAFGQMQHGAGDLVLRFRRQPPHRLKRPFQELGVSAMAD